MELVNRYIAAVQRELPAAKQQEIGRELNANIMDQLDALSEQQGNLSDGDISKVLITMGHPSHVARQFVPQQPLVDSSLMPLYKNTLFMVLGILFLLQVVETTAAWLSTVDMGFIHYLHGLASGFIESACFGFTAITLAFAFTPVKSAKANCKHNNWRPELLPKAEPSWQYIDMSDIFTDLATYIFLLLVVWYPLWIAPATLPQNASLLSDSARFILQWASPVIVLGLLNSLWQLRMRIWSKSLLLGNIVINFAAMLIILYLANSSPLLNVAPEQWQGVFSHAQVEHSATVSLFIIALFPAWEVLRDILRLKKL
tara:strand:- start:1013 stop:1954 length:942 start_codon:yes stop_codon:yes gene_type:complete